MNEIQFLALSAAVNACITWGVVRTQLAWLRRDVDELRAVMLSGRKLTP